MGKRLKSKKAVEPTYSSCSESLSINESSSVTPSDDSDGEENDMEISTPLNSVRPSAGKICKTTNIRTTDSTRSTFSKKSLKKLFDTPQFRGVHVYMANRKDRIHDASAGAMGFYPRMMDLGVGVPIYPFFISILESYGIAPGQLVPFAWCHMMGVYFIWTKLGFGVPSLDVCHHLYKFYPVVNHLYFYYFSIWPKGRNILVKSLPKSSGGWRERFFFLDVATGGSGLHDEFSTASGCLHTNSHISSSFCTIEFYISAHLHVQ